MSTIEVRGGVTGALFDVREPDNVNNGDLQAALKRLPGGNPCNGIEITKLEIRLNQGLQIGVPTSSGTVRARSSNGDLWQGIDFQFRLDGVDHGLCTGTQPGDIQVHGVAPIRQQDTAWSEEHSACPNSTSIRHFS